MFEPRFGSITNMIFRQKRKRSIKMRISKSKVPPSTKRQ
jgi:hypothetical protein